jgi:ORF6N domain
VNRNKTGESQSILVFRGHKVLLDAELAELYGVPTKRLNEQVKRNAARFPEDFLFRLTSAEVEGLNRSHFATGSQKHRDPRLPPHVFTEHGAIMAAMVLNSPRAVEVSVYVVRAFVRLRDLLTSNRQLARRFAQLEARLDKKLTGHDEAIAAILSAIRQLVGNTTH